MIITDLKLNKICVNYNVYNEFFDLNHFYFVNYFYFEEKKCFKIIIILLPFPAI